MAIFTLELLEEIILEETSAKSDWIVSRRNVLIHVKNGHFKYYILDWDDEHNQVRCMWGRIGAHPQSTVYDKRKGVQKYHEKLRKGYEEVTAETYQTLFAHYGNLVV